MALPTRMNQINNDRTRMSNLENSNGDGLRIMSGTYDVHRQANQTPPVANQSSQQGDTIRKLTLSKEKQAKRTHSTGLLVAIVVACTVAVVAITALVLAALSNWQQTKRGALANTSQLVAYTRWGAKDCHAGKRVYYGLMAGSKASSDQSIDTRFLCMPMDEVQYGLLFEANNTIYGTEYKDPIKTESNIDNVPCALCLVSGKSLTRMIPGRTRCHDGWTREYGGYLMAQDGAYECIDESMKAHDGSAHLDHNVATLVHVSASCDSLLCDPYIANKGLACVVCSI